MPTINAAVVTAFDTPPSYQPFPAPTPSAPDEVLVDVVAAGLHPRVRSQADGSHYTSTDELPLVPGIDGVGRAPDGTLRYFVLPDTTMGSMAERTVVDLRRSIVLRDGSDPIALAAVMNPAMASWIALRRRIEFQPGSSVLVLGATGNAGRLALQVAERLGAGQVIGAARRPGDGIIALADVGEAADVDVVLDFVWGEPTEHAVREIVTARKDRAKPLTWVEIGSVAGPTTNIPSAALRAARLQLVGSGQGSVPTAGILQELVELAATAGDFEVDARAVPLAEVTAAWTSGDRVVITPG